MSVSANRIKKLLTQNHRFQANRRKQKRWNTGGNQSSYCCSLCLDPSHTDGTVLPQKQMGMLLFFIWQFFYSLFPRINLVLASNQAKNAWKMERKNSETWSNVLKASKPKPKPKMFNLTHKHCCLPCWDCWSNKSPNGQRTVFVTNAMMHCTNW